MSETAAQAEKPLAPRRVPQRVVSGMRPTGRMHLGNYNGALRGWIEVAKVAKESLFFSADWHALTSDYKDPSGIAAAQREMFADWIAAGLDAEKHALFVPSHVEGHAPPFLPPRQH